MTRNKVKLAFISNDSTRKSTFKKRKKGLLKKVNELSTLCGISACAIIYSPYDSNPEVWPSNSGVQRVVSEFKMLPEVDQQKKMVDQESFLTQRLAKEFEHLKRRMKDNEEMEMTEFMSQSFKGNMGMFPMNVMDLINFGYLIDQKLKIINRRIEILGNSGIEIGESSNAGAVTRSSQGIGSMGIVVSTTVPTATTYEIGSSFSFAPFVNPIHQQQQQFHHPSSPHIGLYEQFLNMNMNLNLDHNHNQNQQQWFMETMNQPQQLRYADEQMTFPFMDNNHHYQPQHQQQHFLAESSTVPATISSSSTIPVTNPNLITNTWFH